MAVTQYSDFTKTQQRILTLLSDGADHTKSEIHAACCPDAELNVVAQHISMIRKKLRPQGEDIVCVFSYRMQYRLVRLINHER